MLSLFEMGIRMDKELMSKQKNSYPLILWVVLNQLLNNFQAFSDFSLGDGVLMMWLILPPSTEAMTSFTELLARTKPAPEPEVAEAPAEAEATSWGVALGRVGWVGWVGLGGHLEWVPFFFPWNHGALSRTSPTVLCFFFVCVQVCKFWFLDF